MKGPEEKVVGVDEKNAPSTAERTFIAHWSRLAEATMVRRPLRRSGFVCSPTSLRQASGGDPRA